MTTGDEVINIEVDLGDALDISHVRGIWEKLSKAMESANSISLKAGQVDVADTSALQMLSVFFLDVKGQNIVVRWDGVAESIYKAAALLGLTKQLDL